MFPGRYAYRRNLKSFFNPARGTSCTHPRLTKLGRHAACLSSIDATPRQCSSQAPPPHRWRWTLRLNRTPRLQKPPKRVAAGRGPSCTGSLAKSWQVPRHQPLREFVQCEMHSSVASGRILGRTSSAWPNWDRFIDVRLPTLIAR